MTTKGSWSEVDLMSGAFAFSCGPSSPLKQVSFGIISVCTACSIASDHEMFQLSRSPIWRAPGYTHDQLAKFPDLRVEQTRMSGTPRPRACCSEKHNVAHILIPSLCDQDVILTAKPPLRVIYGRIPALHSSACT